MTNSSEAKKSIGSSLFSDLIVALGLLGISLLVASGLDGGKFWAVFSVGILGALFFVGSAVLTLWRARAKPDAEATVR